MNKGMEKFNQGGEILLGEEISPRELCDYNEGQLIIFKVDDTLMLNEFDSCLANYTNKYDWWFRFKRISLQRENGKVIPFGTKGYMPSDDGIIKLNDEVNADQISEGIKLYLPKQIKKYQVSYLPHFADKFDDPSDYKAWVEIPAYDEDELKEIMGSEVTILNYEEISRDNYKVGGSLGGNYFSGELSFLNW